MTVNTANNGLFTEQLAVLNILDTLDGALTPEDIHRIRVAIKQLRARLKLLREITGNTPEYEHVSADLKLLSNNLSAQRDRDVALSTLRKIAHKYPGKKTALLVSVLAEQVAIRQQSQTYDPLALGALLQQIRQNLLPYSQVTISHEQVNEIVGHSYGKMCNAGEEALTSETCEDLHTWRKRVKTLGYQLGLLEPPIRQMKNLQRQLAKLGARLGSVHDLCFLTEMLTEIVAEEELDLGLDPLFKRFTRERQELLGKVRKYYQRVCASGAKRFVLSDA